MGETEEIPATTNGSVDRVYENQKLDLLRLMQSALGQAEIEKRFQEMVRTGAINPANISTLLEDFKPVGVNETFRMLTEWCERH